jgi:hypothetical protein
MSVKIHPQFVVDEKGERRSVLLSIEEFNAMVEELEYHADCEALRKAVEETGPEDWVPWEEVKERLNNLPD